MHSRCTRLGIHIHRHVHEDVNPGMQGLDFGVCRRPQSSESRRGVKNRGSSRSPPRNSLREKPCVQPLPRCGRKLSDWVACPAHAQAPCSLSSPPSIHSPCGRRRPDMPRHTPYSNQGDSPLHTSPQRPPPQASPPEHLHTPSSSSGCKKSAVSSAPTAN